jgi:rare lipoprotein A (peptidoglycan hydrolase)
LIVMPSAARSEPARVADVSTGHSRLNVVAGRRASVTGRTHDATAGRPVVLQRRAGHHWLTVARATTRAGGAFTLRFRPRKPVSSRLRLLVDSTRREIGRLNVYRRTSVSWYGPGLYGNRLSCGGRLTPGTLGVAHKTLPCGTRVTLRRGNRVVRVPVVDRGPYVGGREFDLTAATRARLGFGGVGSVLVAS